MKAPGVDEALFSALPLLDMPNALPKQFDEVIVLDTVVNLLPLSPGLDQVHLAQATQVVRHRRLTDPHSMGKSADIQLTNRQFGEQQHPASIAEGTKKLCNVRSSMFVKQEGINL